MNDESQKISVLFVCLGNICRSPMAEAVFKDEVQRRGATGRFIVDSAGTSSWHVGESPDHRTVSICQKHGVKILHKGRQITLRDFSEFDHILCMDERNLETLQKFKPPKSKASVELFGKYDPKGELIIEDPYYGDLKEFQHNFDQCRRCSITFYDHATSTSQKNQSKIKSHRKVPCQQSICRTPHPLSHLASLHNSRSSEWKGLPSV